MQFLSALDPSQLGSACLFGAKAGEILMGLAIFFFVVIPFIGRILLVLKGPPQPKGPARPVRPVRPATPTNVQNEIEEFLRRANQKKTTPANRPQRSPGQAKSSKPGRAEVVRAEVIRERPVGGQVEKHVKQYLDDEEFVRRTKKLGEDVAEADDKIERHLKSVFDHSLSKIAATPGVAAAPPDAKLADTSPEIVPVAIPAAAGDIASMFSNPSSIRQAVILSEILNRPIDRWERER